MLNLSPPQTTNFVHSSGSEQSFYMFKVSRFFFYNKVILHRPQLFFTHRRCKTFFSKPIKKVTKHVSCPSGTVCQGNQTCTCYCRTLPQIRNYKPVVQLSFSSVSIIGCIHQHFFRLHDRMPYATATGVTSSGTSPTASHHT